MRDLPTSLFPHVSFSILLALGLKPRHGYEISRQVSQDSLGRITLGPGALYGTLQKLFQANLIEEVPSENAKDRRRYYRLTKKGWDHLAVEMKYYEQVTRLAQERRITGSIF